MGYTEHFTQSKEVALKGGVPELCVKVVDNEHWLHCPRLTTRPREPWLLFVISGEAQRTEKNHVASSCS